MCGDIIGNWMYSYELLRVPFQNFETFLLQNSTWHLNCFDFRCPCNKNEQVSKSKLLLDGEDDNDVEFDDLDNDGDGSDDFEDRGLQARC